MLWPEQLSSWKTLSSPGNSLANEKPLPLHSLLPSQFINGFHCYKNLPLPGGDLHTAHHGYRHWISTLFSILNKHTPPLFWRIASHHSFSCARKIYMFVLTLINPLVRTFICYTECWQIILIYSGTEVLWEYDINWKSAAFPRTTAPLST